MKTPKPLTLHDVSWELDRIAGAACMSDAAREAAQRAGELVRAVRAGLDLDWDTPASDLHRIGQDVQRREA